MEPRGKIALGVSFLFAVALNMALLCVFATLPPEHVGAQSSSPAPKSFATVVSLARAETPLPKEEGPQEAPPLAPLPQTEITSTATEASSARFYKIDEVDTPALPDSDWNLDAAILDAAGLGRIVFDVLIGRSGDVLGCEIVEPSDINPYTKRSLEERIRQATLQPAHRQGMAVASVRRIELLVQ